LLKFPRYCLACRAPVTLAHAMRVEIDLFREHGSRRDSRINLFNNPKTGDMVVVGASTKSEPRRWWDNLPNLPRQKNQGAPSLRRYTDLDHRFQRWRSCRPIGRRRGVSSLWYLHGFDRYRELGSLERIRVTRQTLFRATKECSISRSQAFARRIWQTEHMAARRKCLKALPATGRQPALATRRGPRRAADLLTPLAPLSLSQARCIPACRHGYE
jgi:hypothetical protein